LNWDRSFSVIDLMRFFIVSAFVSVGCWLWARGHSLA